MRKLIALFALCLSLQVDAATVNLVSLERDDVQTAVDASSTGDILQLPAGSAIWSNKVTVTTAITIRGAGQGLTVLTNAQTSNGSTGNSVFFSLTCTTDGCLRVTGITFEGNKIGNGIVVFGPLGSVGRIDHCTFHEIKTQCTSWNGLMSGVQDHCTAHDCFKTFDVYAGTSRMNESWTNGLTLGTTNCVVIEDCVVYYDTWYPATVIGTASCGLGGRRVWRFNNWTNQINKTVDPILDCHGNQELVENNYSTHRGSRQNEIYGNYFEMTGQTHGCTHLECRGGTFLAYSNVFAGSNMTKKTIYCFEEDGPSRFNWLTNYPGCDQHWMWAWNNTANGDAINGVAYWTTNDAPFIVVGLNVFFSAPPASVVTTPDYGGCTADFSNYAPLVYPHPLVTVQDYVDRRTVGQLTVGTLRGAP